MSAPPAVKIFLPHLFLALALLTGLQGCERLKQTRDAIRAQAGRKPAAAPTAVKKRVADTGGLTVEVTPSSGITILLDDKPIADSSPCQATGLVPGPHMLEVRGMGRHSVLLPVAIEANQTLRVPVALRARASSPYAAPAQEGHRPTEQPPVRGPKASPSSPPPGHHLAAAHRAKSAMPSQFVPLWVAITAQPLAPVVIDGKMTSDTTVQLSRPSGQIKIGPMVLAYVILPGQVAALTVPHDEASWYAGDYQIKAKSVVRVGRNPLVLRRVVEQGANQDVVLRRLL